jgi:hypothetical protein
MLMMRFSPGVPFIASIPIHDKIQNDLLKLDAVAKDRKLFRCYHANQFDVSSDGQRRKRFYAVPCDVVEVETFQFKGCLCQEALHPPHDFAGAPVILQNILHDILELRDVRARGWQHRVCGFRRWSE